MRYLLENCILLLFLFITSSTVAERKFPIICVDKSPFCKRRSHLCQSNAFRSVMQSLCKKTCKLCDENTKEKIIKDDQYENESDEEVIVEVVNVEDDEDINNIEYSEFETTTDQTEKETEEEVTEEHITTKLSTTIPYSIIKNLKQTICMDSSTDCQSKRYLCSERRYAQLMRRECPKTCNLCQPGQTIMQNEMNRWRCQDIAPQCSQSLCDHRSYRQLMLTFCKKTCSLC
ncbi:unnamed protein product [Cercopithifilaria johnstoni]|uniref:ShKT domain-containing protein n=1 Tax=Cercopithifilaria johnstoni TaxID=2874296 RepID=A0A8J2MLT9_9BILA|nr:unnamed protein product [Cercopithifilaria johnstoni]